MTSKGETCRAWERKETETITWRKPSQVTLVLVFGTGVGRDPPLDRGGEGRHTGTPFRESERRRVKEVVITFVTSDGLS